MEGFSFAVVHCRGTILGPRIGCSVNLSARTSGAVMTPGGPREDFLKMVEARLREIYRPIASCLNVIITCAQLKGKTDFSISFKVMTAEQAADLVESFLSPLTKQLVPGFQLDAGQRTVSGFFCRHKLTARLDSPARKEVVITGSLTGWNQLISEH